MWSDELDEYTVAQLAHSYVRRKRFEARLLTVELTPRQPARPVTTKSAPAGQGMSLDALFDVMGADGFEG